MRAEVAISPRSIAWAAIALLAAYIVFVGGGDAGGAGIYDSTTRGTNVLLAAGVIAVWLLVAWRRPEWRPSSVLMPAFAAALLSLAISTVFSEAPRMSGVYLGYAILLIALYMVLVRLMANDFFRPRIMGLGALLFVLVAVEFIGGVGILWLRWWNDAGELTAPPLRPYFLGLAYGNPSAVLTIVALFGVPTAVVLVRERFRVAAFVVIVLIIGLVAVLSGSRAGWLAIAIATAVGLVIAAVTSSDASGTVRAVGRRLAAGRSRAQLVAMTAVPILVVTVVVVAVAPGILRRIDAGGETLRETFYAVALRLFAQSPVVGIGPGLWVVDRIQATQPQQIDFYIPHAHDVPLQTLAELGIVGGIAGFVLVMSLARLLVGALRSQDGRERWLGWLTSVAVIYLALHDLLDFYANMPAVLFAVAIPIAALDASATQGGPGRLRLPAASLGRRVTIWSESLRALGDRIGAPIRFAAGAMVLAVLTGGLLLQEIPARLNEQAVAAANAGDMSLAAELGHQAVSEDPGIHAYEMTAGLAAAAIGDASTAAADFGIVAQRDGLPEAWLDLAAMDAQLGRGSQAVADLNQAMRLGAQREVIAMPAGNLYLQLGEQGAAANAFAAALALRPSLATDPWWSRSPATASLLPQAVSLALPLATDDRRWELALLTGDIALARQDAESSSSPRLADQVIGAWTHDPGEADQLYQACNQDPLDLDQLLWCARVAEHLADGGRAQRYRLTAEGIDIGSSGEGAELRVETATTQGPLSRRTATYWGLYTYLRPTPADLLVGSLLHLVLI